MSEKHTEGPWELCWEDGKHGVVAAAVEGKMVFVGMITNADDDPIKTERRKANAQLVSAAPEMLEGLKQAKEWLEGWASAESELSYINNIISKALGESQ